MTVRELIALLHAEDPEALVILQKDQEGNDYSPLWRLWAGHYQAHSAWSGQMRLAVLTDEARIRGYTGVDLVEGVPAVSLVPTN